MRFAFALHAFASIKLYKSMLIFDLNFRKWRQYVMKNAPTLKPGAYCKTIIHLINSIAGDTSKVSSSVKRLKNNGWRQEPRFIRLGLWQNYAKTFVLNRIGMPFNLLIFRLLKSKSLQLDRNVQPGLDRELTAIQYSQFLLLHFDR